MHWAHWTHLRSHTVQSNLDNFRFCLNRKKRFHSFMRNQPYSFYCFLAVPNEPPVILESNSTTSTTIRLKWSEVKQLNSAPLLGYVIVYKEIDKKFHVNAMKSVATAPRETILEDLKKFTNYTIRVYAFTSNGNGVPSDAISLRTQEDGKFTAVCTSFGLSCKMARNVTWGQ